MVSWIKMRTDLATDPRVIYVANRTGQHPLRIVGALYALWAIADAHTTDGRLVGYTRKTIDDHVGFKGFAEALESINGLPGSTGPWLIMTEVGAEIPDFSRHNGESAKARAQTARRVDRSRNARSVTDVTPSPLQKAQPEQERERKKKSAAASPAAAGLRQELAKAGIAEPTLSELAQSELTVDDVIKAAKARRAGKGIGALVLDLRAVAESRRSERLRADAVAQAKAWYAAQRPDSQMSVLAEFRQEHPGTSHMTDAAIAGWSRFWSWVLAKLNGSASSQGLAS